MAPYPQHYARPSSLCFSVFACTCKVVGWLVGCFGFNGPLRQYFSLYRAVSQREGERGEKRIDESKNVQTTPTRTYYKRSMPLPYCNPNCRMPQRWKFTQHHRTTRPPLTCKVIRWIPLSMLSDNAITDRYSDTLIFQLRAYRVWISWSTGSEKLFRHVPPTEVEPSNSCTVNTLLWPLGQALHISMLKICPF